MRKTDTLNLRMPHKSCANPLPQVPNWTGGDNYGWERSYGWDNWASRALPRSAQACQMRNVTPIFSSAFFAGYYFNFQGIAKFFIQACTALQQGGGTSYGGNAYGGCDGFEGPYGIMAACVWALFLERARLCINNSLDSRWQYELPKHAALLQAVQVLEE